MIDVYHINKEVNTIEFIESATYLGGVMVLRQKNFERETNKLNRKEIENHVQSI